MNYEQKYNEMVQRARELHESGNALTKQQMEIVCPELCESEDERIRKAALEGIEHLERNLGWDAIGDIDILDVKEYLEKQKERGPLTNEEEYTLQRIIEYLEDETCPSEWISLLHDIYCLPYEKQKEQKPAEWSEDDIKKIRSEEYTKGFNDAAFGGKLKEWSEEDEENLRSIISRLNISMDGVTDTVELTNIVAEIKWLKSLRPDSYKNCNSRWKPSKEQMKILNWVANGMVDKSIAAPEMRAVLRELYEQLKQI